MFLSSSKTQDFETRIRFVVSKTRPQDSSCHNFSFRRVESIVSYSVFSASLTELSAKHCAKNSARMHYVDHGGSYTHICVY